MLGYGIDSNSIEISRIDEGIQKFGERFLRRFFTKVDIEIRNGANGRPVLILHGEALRLSTELGITQWDVSLTHSQDVATAIAVAV